jgi:Mn2+/Fe2+ NRAMP family transporter
VVPLASAYSVSEALGAEGRLGDDWRTAPVFHRAYLAMIVPAAVIVSVPGLPLLGVLVGSQTLNAVLLCPQLLLMRRLAGDRALMGDLRLGRAGSARCSSPASPVRRCQAGRPGASTDARANTRSASSTMRLE